jgi:hypothetical protein
VLIAFNRPEETRRMLSRIRQAAPSHLFLLADGPRADHPEDLAGCAAVRRELEAVDWPCQVHRRYNDVNQGNVPTTEHGLDWVFEEVEEAIVLEDDCLPNDDFFRFCTELLDRYRDTERVWQISARAPSVPVERFAGASYCFARVGAIWGWATWRRAWRAYRSSPGVADEDGAAPGAADLEAIRDALLTRGGRRYFLDIARDRIGTPITWDNRWLLSILRAHGLVAVPRANLVENIGYGKDATNTRVAIPQRGLESLAWPLTHPEALTVNPAVERLAERLLAAYMGRLARRVSRLLGRGRVRDLARRVVSLWRDRGLQPS